MLTTSHIRTWSGFFFYFRRANQGDRLRLAEFWEHVSRHNVGSRSLGTDHSSHQNLPDIPHAQGADLTSTFLALEGDGGVIAIALLTLLGKTTEARVVIIGRDDITADGINWALLARVLIEAQACGATMVSSILDSDDIAAIKLEVPMDFAESVFAEDHSQRLLEWTLPQQALPQAWAAI